MSVRRATSNDLHAICSLLSQLGGYDNTQEFMDQKLQDLLDHPDHYLLLHESDGAVDGLVALTIVPELGLSKDTALITYLVVSEHSRSKGVGRILEQECCRMAMKRNCGRIQLHCSLRRTRAHAFYESIGYTEQPKYFSKPIFWQS